MDPALKQRLVGAAVLVALAVILVPMLLEAPEPEATPAAQLPLEVPARPDLTLQTRDLPLTLPAPTAPAAPPGVEPDAVVSVQAETPPRVDALQGSAGAAAPVPGASAPAPGPSDPPAPAPPAATPAPAVSQTPSAPAAVTAPKPAAAAPQTGAVAASSGRFVVNLGSYANAANAEALRQRLAARGYPLRSERIEVDGKPAQRLRAGPFRSRAEAEAAALRLNQAEPGAKFSVAELEAAEAVAGAAPRVAQGFAVQLGAFKDEADALALRDRLRGGGFAAYTERASTDAGPLWRVRAGPELQRERAEALQKRIRDLLKLEGIVVSHP
jgi:DedD protein